MKHSNPYTLGFKKLVLKQQIWRLPPQGVSAKWRRGPDPLTKEGGGGAAHSPESESGAECTCIVSIISVPSCRSFKCCLDLMEVDKQLLNFSVLSRQIINLSHEGRRKNTEKKF